MRSVRLKPRGFMRLSHDIQTFCVSLLLALVMAAPCVAATFTVNSTGDSHATNLVTGQDAGGFVTLRSALEAATGTAGAHVINFSITGSINLSLGQITVGNAGLGNNISITGPGANVLTINQTTTNRIFSTGIGAVTFLLQDVTLHYTGSPGAITGGGGAIVAGGAGAATTLLNCTITGFNIQQGNGGAISASTTLASHNLTITNCVFTNNECGGAGGAVSYNGQGAVSITKTLFVNNRTGAVGISSGGDGGALSTTGGAPGGIYNVAQCTFTDNHSASHGGTISNANGQLALMYNRFFANTAATPSDGNTLWQAGGSAGNSITANDNWWGQNAGPLPTDLAVGASPVTPISVGTWLQLRATASPPEIPAGGAANFVADILGRNAGGPIPGINLAGLASFPGTFSNPVLGTLSSAPVNVTFTEGQSGSAVFTAGSTGGNGSIDVHADNQTAKGTVTISQPLAITLQPKDTMVCAGSEAKFSSAASGFPVPSVQWQVSTDGGTSWSDIAGANAGAYVFTAQASDQGHQYRAVWTSGTSPAATSTAAILAVNKAPTVTLQPSPVNAAANTVVAFTSAATGSPLPTVQWQVSTDGGTTFSDVPAATSATLTFSSAISQNGYEYRAVFSNVCGIAMTNAAILTVTGTIPSITLQPADVTVCAGDTASLTSSADGTPIPTVQWQVSADSGATWTNVPPPGGTANPLRLTPPLSDNDKQYRAVFTNAAGTVTSASATLTVNSPAAVTFAPVDQVVTNGSPATFSAAASGRPQPAVQWQVSSDGGGSWIDVPGAMSTTLNLPPVQLSQNGYQYRAVFVNGCGADTTDVAFLTVKAQANDLGPVTVFLSRLAGLFDHTNRVTLMAEMFKNGTSIAKDSLVNQRVAGFIFPSSKRYVIPVRATDVSFQPGDVFKIQISVRGEAKHHDAAVLLWYNDDSVKNSSRGWSRVYKSTLGSTTDKYYYLRINHKLSEVPGRFAVPSLVVLQPTYQSFGTWSAEGSDLKTITGVEEVDVDVVPTSYVLSQNFPNPFNPSTSIQFDLPSDGEVTLKVYDVIGREVASLVDEKLAAGRYRATWDASKVASGVYFYRIQAGTFIATKKLLLVK